MKLLYMDCNDITKHVVLQDVMEHAVNDNKKKPRMSYNASLVLLMMTEDRVSEHSVGDGAPNHGVKHSYPIA
jgi:hypothetical protein